MENFPLMTRSIMKNKLKIVFGLAVLIIAVLVFGPSWLNMFKGPEDNYRNYYAGSLKSSYDSTIQSEINKEPPSGYLTKPYDPQQYQEVWNRIFFHLLDSPFPEAYVGPTEQEFVEYIITERRKNGLPEIVLEDRVKKLVEPPSDPT